MPFFLRKMKVHHALLRATQSPLACVSWVGHGTLRLYARGVLVRTQAGVLW
jgi:hypothetical protein